MAISHDLHIDRLRTAINNSYDHDKVPGWIEQNTWLAGKPFSFTDHEYQLKILGSKKRVKYTKKCSQLGISELKVRYVLALCSMIPHFSTILTLPTSGFASIFCKTRIDPVISESEVLRDSLDKNLDSTELKKLGQSFLYIRGTFTQNAAISVPADLLAHDEVDFSSEDALTSFQSRLTHSKWKMRMETSTPTVADYGIDKRFQSSNRSYQLVKCSHCNHTFYPDYKQHVVIPGFNGNILDLDEQKLFRTRWQEGYLACPHCGNKPELTPQYRQWVVENPDEQFDADGFQLSPFDAPAFISVQDLMVARTRYKRQSDFVNFSLGQCAEDSESGIQDSDLDAMEAMHPVSPSGAYVFGIDAGVTCHLIRALVDSYGRLHVVERKLIDFRELDAVVSAMVKTYRPIAIVMDSQPYTETVFRLQSRFQMLYGSVYVTKNSLVPYVLRDTQEALEDALLDQRQIDVNRSVALDALMNDIREGGVTVSPDLDDGYTVFRQQLRDMKRVREDVKITEVERFRWVKTKGYDHFHHALLYAWVAARLRIAARPRVWVPPMLMTKRKITTNV